MMAGPWHCTRLSWFPAWPCRKFRSINRKAATAFLSMRTSTGRHKGDRCASRACRWQRPQALQLPYHAKIPSLP